MKYTKRQNVFKVNFQVSGGSGRRDMSRRYPGSGDPESGRTAILTVLRHRAAAERSGGSRKGSRCPVSPVLNGTG